MNDREAPSRIVRETVRLDAVDSLLVKNHRGGIEVAPWDRGEVEVVARIQAPDGLKQRFARKLVDSTRIAVEQVDGGLQVRSDFDRVPAQRRLFRTDRILPTVHYEIRIPQSLRLSIEDHRSVIHLRGLCGAVAVRSHRSELTAEDTRGDLLLRTHAASLRVHGHRGTLDVLAKRGDLELRGVAIDGDSRLRFFEGRAVLGLLSPQGLTLTLELARRATFHSDLTIEELEQQKRWRRCAVNGGGPQLAVKSHRGAMFLRSALPAGAD